MASVGTLSAYLDFQGYATSTAGSIDPIGIADARRLYIGTGTYTQSGSSIVINSYNAWNDVQISSTRPISATQYFQDGEKLVCNCIPHLASTHVPQIPYYDTMRIDIQATASIPTSNQSSDVTFFISFAPHTDYSNNINLFTHSDVVLILFTVTVSNRSGHNQKFCIKFYEDNDWDHSHIYTHHLPDLFTRDDVRSYPTRVSLSNCANADILRGSAKYPNKRSIGWNTVSGASAIQYGGTGNFPIDFEPGTIPPRELILFSVWKTITPIKMYLNGQLRTIQNMYVVTGANPQTGNVAVKRIVGGEVTIDDSHNTRHFDA